MKRILIAALIAVAAPAHADGVDCQSNILNGQSVLRDTQSSAIISPLPYARHGEAVGKDYEIILAGGDDSQGTGYNGGAMPAVNLQGTEWVLATLNGQPVQERTTLSLEPGGRMGGNAPCNRYFGQYSQGAGVALSFSQIGATRRACPALSEEGAYFDALNRTTEFRIGREGDFLALFGSYQTELATFASAAGPGPGVPTTSLTGSWNVTGVLIEGLLQSGPELGGVNITFRADGSFSAQLGCNNASGSYSSDGNKLLFGPVAVTERQCFAPAPFEGPILALLPLVRWVESSGNGGALLDGDRRTLITLAR